MKKIGIMIIICTLILVGCNKQITPKTQESDTKIKIGLSFDSFVIERWHREQDAFMSQAEALGAEVYVQNANGDSNKQISQVEYFIKQGIDTLVIVPTDAEAIVPVIKKAKEAGIKVIAYDRMISGADIDLYMSFDNEVIGRLLTNGLLEGVKEDGNILVIMGSPTDPNVNVIDNEFEKLLKKNPRHMIDKVYAENWRAEVAFSTVSKYLKAGEKIGGIFCGNDDLAEQAIKALSEYRLAGEVCVVGQDGDLSACQRIVEGTQSMTIYKNVMILAKEAATLSVKLAKGEDINIEETINDGKEEIPYKRLIPTKVTKENMNQVIIESGFHLKDDVYLNLVDKES